MEVGMTGPRLASHWSKTRTQISGHVLCAFHCCLVTKSCLTLFNPIDCSTPGSSVHGISQARILEWVEYWSG